MSGPESQRLPLLDLSAIERELDMIALAIGDTRVALQGGGVIDLAGLDDRVATICAGLEAQPHETARVLLPKLVLLVQDLNMLSAACAQAQAETDQAIRRMSGSRASQAYGKPALSPIPGMVRD